MFDPALCRSTGVCGPEVDGAPVPFAAGVEWPKARGVPGIVSRGAHPGRDERARLAGAHPLENADV